MDAGVYPGPAGSTEDPRGDGPDEPSRQVGPYVGSARPPAGALISPSTPASGTGSGAGTAYGRASVPRPTTPVDDGAGVDGVGGLNGASAHGVEPPTGAERPSAVAGLNGGSAVSTGDAVDVVPSTEVTPTTEAPGTAALAGTPVKGYGRAPVPRRTSAPARRSPWRNLTPEGAGVDYVEGRPGQELVEDLAEQRRRELPTTKDAERSQDSKRRVMPLWQELPLLVIVSFCVAVLVRSFLVQAFVIPSGSMEDTLLVGDRVLVNKIVYESRDPRRGEVVVFRGTDRWAAENLDEKPGDLFDRIGDTLGDLVGMSRPGEKDFIKRVIGVPGDRVACCDPLGRVTINGVGIDEPYLKSNNSLQTPPMAGHCGPRRFTEVVVPPGELFLMGDNRAMSQDSRCQGTVPIDNVVGRAFLRVWPPSRWGGLGDPPSYAGVPPAAAVPVVPDPVSTVVAVAVLAVPLGRWSRRSPSLELSGNAGSGHRRWRAPRTLRRWSGRAKRWAGQDD